MSGLVGSFGNLGGIIFGLVFRFQTESHRRAFWIMRVISIALDVLVIPISGGK